MDCADGGVGWNEDGGWCWEEKVMMMADIYLGLCVGVEMGGYLLERDQSGWYFL